MISAVTLIIKNMEQTCNFYSNLPGFKLIYGGSSGDSFTSYQIGEHDHYTFLNLELCKLPSGNIDNESNNKNFGRIIFHTKNVDKLYTYFKNNKVFSNLILLENEPVNAPWKERYFHVRDPNGFELSFAQPI